MTLGYLVRGLVLVMAGHAIVTAVLSVVVIAMWRRPPGALLAPAAREARRLFLLRLSPTVAAVVVAWMGVGTAFVLWEPRVGDERVGAAALVLAGMGLAQVASAAWRVTQAMMHGRRVRRALVRSAADTKLSAPPMPTQVIDAGFPVVAVAGIVRPHLFVARTVVEACTPEEMCAIFAHEQAHCDARDNLRRLLLAAAADPLVWTSVGTAMARAWATSAELAADEASSRDRRTRLHLASALVKVARLATTLPGPLPASTLFRGEVIADRVRRLLDSQALEGSPPPRGPGLLVAGIVVGGAPLWMPVVYETVELLMKAGTA